MPANTDTAITLDEVIQQLQAGGALPAELLEIFAEEAEDHLQTIYDGLGRLGTDNSDFAALADVRRSSHTLKGAAAAVNLKAATRLAHRMEDLLDRLAENKKKVTKKQTRLLLTTADQLQALTAGNFDVETVAKQVVDLYEKYAEELSRVPTAQPEADPQPADAEIESATDVAREIDSISSQQGEPAQTVTANVSNRQTQFLRVPLDRLDELVNLVGELIVNRSAIVERLNAFESRIADMQTALDRLRNATHEIETNYSVQALDAHVICNTNYRTAQNAIPNPHGSIPGGAHEFDSLEFDQYTDFHLLAHTLSEANNDAETVTDELSDLSRALETLVTRQEHLNRGAQQNLMRIRMVSLSGIVSRLERTVRTVSNKLNRDVELEVAGGETELDKTVLDEITDPLLHLIRNAIDHGVESPKERAAAGKPETARLKIEAIHQGTRVTIRITDDGSGIDLEKVRRHAIRRDLIREDQELSSDELHALIFVPGFSTADKLTDVSGRGVGMDVVCDTVSRLKGTIRVDSEPAKGTTFTIQLPSTLGVTRALLVQAKGDTFAIPIQSVQQIGRIDPDHVKRNDDQSTVDIDGTVMPIRDLATHLQLVANDNTRLFDDARSMLVVQAGNDEVALTIDSIKGGQEIVIKTLGDHLQTVPGLIGATLAGDGTVIPILDPADLVGQRSGRPHLKTHHYRTESPVRARRNLAMVIDDSISVRRVTTNLLQSAGWETVSAKDGIDALEKLDELETSPDVFLCDMEMPRMDGIELIKQIRKQSEFELTPIVMVTSRASEKHRHKAIDAGATDYVVKPYNDERLLALITDLVQSVRETVTA